MFITAETGFRQTYLINRMTTVIDRRVYVDVKTVDYKLPPHAVFSVYDFMSNLIVTLSFSSN